MTSTLPTVMPRGADMRALLERTGMSLRALAKEYRVSHQTIAIAKEIDHHVPWVVTRWPWRPLPEHCGNSYMYRALTAHTKRMEGVELTAGELTIGLQLAEYLDRGRVVVCYDPGLHSHAGFFLADRIEGEPVWLDYLVERRTVILAG